MLPCLIGKARLEHIGGLTDPVTGDQAVAGAVAGRSTRRRRPTAATIRRRSRAWWRLENDKVVERTRHGWPSVDCLESLRPRDGGQGGSQGCPLRHRRHDRASWKRDRMPSGCGSARQVQLAVFSVTKTSGISAVRELGGASDTLRRRRESLNAAQLQPRRTAAAAPGPPHAFGQRRRPAFCASSSAAAVSPCPARRRRPRGLSPAPRARSRLQRAGDGSRPRQTHREAQDLRRRRSLARRTRSARARAAPRTPGPRPCPARPLRPFASPSTASAPAASERQSGTADPVERGSPREEVRQPLPRRPGIVRSPATDSQISRHERSRAS